jgi:hypothetical protein
MTGAPCQNIIVPCKSGSKKLSNAGLQNNRCISILCVVVVVMMVMMIIMIMMMR